MIYSARELSHGICLQVPVCHALEIMRFEGRKKLGSVETADISAGQGI